MGILQNFEEGKMEQYRSLKNSEFGTKDLYISKDLPPNSPLGSEGFSYNAINSRTNDLERIAKLLKDKPGLKYISNNALLNTVDTSAKIQRAGKEKGKFSLKQFTKDVGKGLLDGIINTTTQVGTILAQVPVNGTGLHFINGLFPNGYLRSGDANLGLGNFFSDLGIGGGINGAKSVKNGMPVPTNVEQRLESILNDQGSLTNDISDRTIKPEVENRYLVDDFSNGATTTTYNVSGVSIENKFKKTQSGNNHTSADYINGLAEQTDSILGNGDDIIPFEFHRLGIEKEDKGIFLYFRAFLDSFNDNYSGEWSGTRYIGRAEQFYTYQGFNREIQFSFKIAAFSKVEINPLYRKLNLLAGTTAPSYNANGDFMRGTLTSITIGDYLVAQKGFISNIGLSWEKGYPWEITTGDTEEKGNVKPELRLRVPHILNVNVSFTPIHEFNVKTDLDLSTNDKYIGGFNTLENIPIEQVRRPRTEPTEEQTQNFDQFFGEQGFGTLGSGF